MENNRPNLLNKTLIGVNELKLLYFRFSSLKGVLNSKFVLMAVQSKLM